MTTTDREPSGRRHTCEGCGVVFVCHFACTEKDEASCDACIEERVERGDLDASALEGGRA